MRLSLSISAIALPVLLAGTPLCAGVDFNRDIRPILNKECISCHGGVKKAGGISLQFREEVLKEGESGGHVIVPGKPEASEVFLRLTATDADDRMPKKAPALKPEVIAKFKQWIAEGAPWAQHWSLAPLVKPAPPAIAKVRPIDAFVRARLAAEKLAPAPEAARPALLRRLSLDLIGLPPTPAEIEAFVKNAAPDAYEKEVSRLLASPRFGERWAALWMDLARYSDSKGYEADRTRQMWPYRDWLVNAFNADLHFDQFTIKQLAGDLLPNATDDDRIATAMHRLTSTNDEGGTDDEEFRTSAVIDRVNTTWETWLGTSLGCAQCHDHPYDPFRNQEFYQALAFFNNTADADRQDDAPTLSVYRNDDDRAKIIALDAEIAKLRAESDALKKQIPGMVDHWQPLAVKEASAGAGLNVTVKESEVHLEGAAPATDTTTVLAPLTTPQFGSVRIETLPQRKLPGKGAGLGRDGNFVLTGFSASLLLADGREQPVAFVEARADFEQGGHLAAHVLKNPNPDENGWAVAPQINKAHSIVFRAAAPVPVPAGAQLRIKLVHGYTAKGQYQNASLGHFKVSAAPEALPPVDPRTAKVTELNKQHDAKKKERDGVAKSITKLPVFAELAPNKVRKTHMFVRGNWMTKGAEVQAATPASLPPLPADAPRNRLTFAQWLVAKENPLTARVAVNRIWEQLFGIGLVETAEDFGTKGDAPSHPELLDWLAATFRDDFRWSTKQLLREVVLSHTYRQETRATPELATRDPRNRLLARGPRVRLSAEMVRDNALTIAGLLSDKAGGPSVMPPLPEGVLPPSPYNDDRWTTPAGADRYRRAIYTFWKRSNPYPSMLTFDSAERTICTSRRLRTNTPLQALVTLNDPVYVEAAQALARRMKTEGGAALEAQLARGWLLATALTPTPETLAKLGTLYRESLGDFQKSPESAKKLAGTPEEATLTNVASVLLNLDQVLTK